MGAEVPRQLKCSVLMVIYNNITLSFQKVRMINTGLLSQITLPEVNQQLYCESWQTLRQKYLLSPKIQSLKEIHVMAEKLNLNVAKNALKAKDTSPKRKLEAWAFGEFKIFETVCVVYSLLCSKQLQLFGELQYNHLKKIFLMKSEPFLRYQLASLIKAKARNNSEWKKTEVQMFAKIVEDQHFQGTNSDKLDQFEWGYYSFQLFTKSKGRYYRTLQQCREKWINYLNPALSHARWTIQEDIRLFELIGQLGFKWSAISKAFNLQRTEHMVKNRFNSITKTWKNKDAKSISAQEILERVLNILYERARKGTQLQKKQLCQLFNHQPRSISLKLEHIKIFEQNNSREPIISQLNSDTHKKSQLNSKAENDRLPSQDKSEEYPNVCQVSDSKLLVQDWHTHFKLLSKKASRAEKQEKDTWDIQLIKPNEATFKSETKYSFEKEIIEVQGLNAFDFQLQKNNNFLGSFRRGFSHHLSEMHEWDNVAQEQHWLAQFEEKAMLSWIE